MTIEHIIEFFESIRDVHKKAEKAWAETDKDYSIYEEGKADGIDFCIQYLDGFTGELK